MASDGNMFSHTLSFDISQLNLRQTEIDGTQYTEVTWGKLHNGGEPGFPSLPAKSFNVSVPADATDFLVEVTVNKIESISLPSPPLPAQYPALASIEYENPPFIHLLSSSERLKTFQGQHRGEINGIGTVGGFNKIVSLTALPILWNENENSIEVATEMTIKLSWSTNPTELDNLVLPGFKETMDDAVKTACESVVNPQDVVSNYSSILKLPTMAKAASSNEYLPYIIVTTKELASSLERLAAFRRLRGFQTKIFCIEDILTDSKFASGDVISGLNDDAGKLRAFIKYAYSSFGTQYVLLAGEYPKIPGRWADYSNEEYISDLYFRDITTLWRLESSGFNNPEKLKGIGSDINIGRLNLSTPEEFTNYFNKLIQYEFNIHNINLSYLNNAFVLYSYDNRINSKFEELSLMDYTSNFVYLKQMRVHEEGITYGSEAVESMKTDFWGFIDWRTHGHYGGVGTTSIKDQIFYGINALDSDKASFVEEKFNGLDNWENKNHPCWTLSMSCTTAQIGKDAMKKNTYSFAESFLLGKDYGGIVFIGDTGPGLISGSSRLVKHIFQHAIQHYTSGINLPLSSLILNKGIFSCPYESYGDNHVKATIGLFGDPLVPLWMKQPMKSSTNGVFNPPSLAIKESVNYAKCFLSDNSTENGVGIIGDFKDINETENYTLINSRTDILPFIHPIKISGLTVNQDRYWFMGKVRFASSGSQNSIKINNGKKVTIEAMDEVELGGNILLETGSQLNISSYRPLSMNDCKFKDKGNIILDASSKVVIGNGTEIPLGFSLTVSKP